MDLQYLVTAVKSGHRSVAANWGRWLGRSVPTYQRKGPAFTRQLDGVSCG